ncbi:aldolase [Paenibacillus harenae]|uniref:Aldolase n=1 Tax=Paenibacillus harenae TaxID=306543 RepID=A0ABT9U9F2_PAEHA|nr:aldolase [Paenibacillus harenae]MDQ0114819.1 hypothetical protein [Paenibacillus harenae]
MILTEQSMVYKAFGLSIRSPLPLPELPRWHFSAAEHVDVEITIDDSAPFKDEVVNVPYQHVVQGNDVLFYIPNTACYCIRDGKSITVARHKDADIDLMRLYILGTCMGAVLMQRRTYPLHGSVVSIRGKAYAVVGESGAGKSTLASALMREGFPLLSDDLIAVSLTGEQKTAIVTPSYPHQKLWQQSLDQFGMSSNDYRSIYGRETKFSIPVTEHFLDEPQQLAGVFELVKAGQDQEVGIQPIRKLDRLQTLYNHTFRQFLIPRLGLMQWHFDTSAAIANQIDMFQLIRPENRLTSPELVACILEAIHNPKINDR